MKLMTEVVDSHDVKFITEGTAHEKKYIIEGPFVQAEVKNRNGRIYRAAILEREIIRYNEEFVSKNRAVGELDHPPTPTVSYKEACHLITKLEFNKDDNIGYGRATILDTPIGRIAKSLMDGGVRLAVSSRGVGSLQEGYVGEDFRLLTVDIVSNPSAPSAFVEGILENKEFIIKDNMIVEVAIEQLEEAISKSTKNLYSDLSLFIQKLRKNP